MPVVRVSTLQALAGEPVWAAAIEDLLAAVDAHVPLPRRHVDAPFLMPVESVLTISGRSTVVTGAVEQGSLRVGEAVEVIGFDAGNGATGPRSSVVTGWETFGQTLPQAQAADNAALLLRGIRRHQVRRGQVVAHPGTVHARQQFTATLRVLTPAEGGRRTAFTTGYRPQFHIRTADTVGLIDLGPTGTAPPGHTVTAEITLGVPLALTTGLGFAVREGGHTVAAGTVTELRD